MKFPRNARILRSQFDVAPFAAVFFCLVIFMLLGALLPTAGIPLRPPTASDLPGVDKPTVAMAVDATGRFYFENQIVSELVLSNCLKATVVGAHEPLTLVIHADKAVTYEQIAHLSLLARDCGITNALLATLPRVVDATLKQ
jgi:biopolymer transport protein ExbD